VNKAIIVGRIGSELEVRKTKTGKAVMEFSVATSEFVNGERTTEWHRVVAWERNAKFLEQYGEKGREVGVEGRLQTDEWEKDGVKRQKTRIIAWNVELYGKKPEDKSTVHEPDDSDDDSLPF
jgi:single-strand DNA-binding protein